MHVSVLSVILGTIGLSWASSSSTTTRNVVHEKRAFVPAKWSYSRKLHGNVVLPMRFGYVAGVVYHVTLTYI